MRYSDKRKVKVSMVSYLKKILKGFPEAIVGISPNPSSDHIFNVSEKKGMWLLGKERVRAYHNSVAQLMFVTTRCRHCIQTAVYWRLVCHGSNGL